MRNRTNIYELMEKVNQYDEGRKSAYASGEDDGGEKNIINQLRKATNMSTFKVTFDDGKKQSVPINVAQAALDKAMRMKPSREKWVKNTWPLIDHKMSRKSCLDW